MTSSVRIVAVTGASGFLGRYFSQKLIERGYGVRALSSRPLSGGPGLEAITLDDPCDLHALGRAFHGVDAVIHLAGLAHVTTRLDASRMEHAFWRANVKCVESVCRAARHAGSSHVVLMSSAAVVGEGDHPVVSVATPAQPTSTYGKSKLEGEARAHDVLGSSAVRLRVFRPPLVYGPGMRGNPLRLFSLVDRGVPLPLGGIRNRRSIISAHNLFHAVEAAIRSDVPTGEPLYVSDTLAPSTPELVVAIGEALHRPVRLVPIPRLLLRALEASPSWNATALPSWLRRPLEDLHRLTTSFVIDQTIARETFGFVPPLTLADGLREAADWWRLERKAPRT